MESLNQALIECVRAAGGSGNVGPKLWPEKTQVAAQRLLLDCLSDDRPAHLTPDHVMLILRLARAKNCHTGFAYLAEDLGYAPPVPVDPRDKLADLQRDYIVATERMAQIADKMSQLLPHATANNLRAVA